MVVTTTDILIYLPKIVPLNLLVLLYKPINSARNSVWCLWQPDTIKGNFSLASIERIFFDSDTKQIKNMTRGMVKEKSFIMRLRIPSDIPPIS